MPAFVKRSWISPVTGISFLAVAITGILLLADVKGPSIKHIHEWMGVFLTIAGTLHLILNYRAFLALFRQRAALVAMVLSVALCVALGFTAKHEGKGKGQGNGQHRYGQGARGAGR